MAAVDGTVERDGEVTRRQQFNHFSLQPSWIEADWLFHRDQRQQVHQMILDDIVVLTNAVVVTGSVTKFLCLQPR